MEFGLKYTVCPPGKSIENTAMNRYVEYLQHKPF